MNRTIFFSIVGLGVLSAAGIAGSRAQQASVVTCNGSAPSAPVVLVTQPDGNCVVARCVTLTACDPKAKGKGNCQAYTFSTQGGLVNGSAAISTQAAPSGNGLVAITGSGLGGGSCATGVLALPTQVLGQDGDVATVTVGNDATKASNLLQRISKERELASSAEAEAELEPLVVDLDVDDGDHWKVDLEHALAAAHGQYSVNQDELRESVQRATEEARATQERARETYEQAMERYREAMVTAQERSRESRERMLVERRADLERAAQRSKRASPRSVEKARADRDETLESRVAALEEAARERGHSVDANRSLEERVAQLEKLAGRGSAAPKAKTFMQTPGGFETTTPLPRTFKLRSPNALVPTTPTPPTPPPAPSPFKHSDSFPQVRRIQPSVPSMPAPAQMSEDEREQMGRAMADLKREAARLREELTRMRAEVERLPRADGAR